MVQILQIDPLHPNPELLKQACTVLETGGLVIVPTETVYGIACDPTVPGAMEKLAAAKGRDVDKPVARLAANTDQVQADANDWNLGLAALAAKFWPGPLTIVLETSTSWTGYRVPNHAVSLELAKTCGHVLALTSANLSGEPDTRTAQEAIDAVAAEMALDAGPSAEKAVPSTVVKVDGEKIECLREGCLSFSEVARVFQKGLGKTKTVLFVCTGNTCRSPMAAALFRHRIGDDAGWNAVSAGVCADYGMPASAQAVEAMRELGIEIENHLTQPITLELVEEADLIVVMTAGHRSSITRDFPDVENKVYLINSFGTSKVAADISDPFGGSLNVYKRIRDEIDRALSDLILVIRTNWEVKGDLL